MQLCGQERTADTGRVESVVQVLHRASHAWVQSKNIGPVNTADEAVCGHVPLEVSPI